MALAQTMRGMRALSGIQDAVIGDLIAALDSPDYPHIALRSLYQLVPCDGAAMFVYSADDLVYVAADELMPMVGARFVPSYSRSTYRHSPFFQHHRTGGLANGTYAMGHLARLPNIRKPSAPSSLVDVDASEEAGYRTHGWPKRLAEIDIAVRLSPEKTAQIALYRCGNATFSPTEISALAGINQALSALYTKYWQRAEMDGKGDEDKIALALQSLANGRLSKRELETLALGIQGREVRDIATAMGVSEETIKTHRKRAYAKIGVRSQNDILLALLRMTMAP